MTEDSVPIKNLKRTLRYFSIHLHMIEQKGMTFDHEFAYSFSFSSYLFFWREEKRAKEKTMSWSKVMPFCSITTYIYQFTYLSIHLTIHLSFNPSFYLSIYLFAHLSLYPSINISIYPSFYIYIYLYSIYQSIYISIYL